MNVSFFVPMRPDFIGRFGFALSHLTNYSDRGVVDIMKFDVVGAIHLDSKQKRTTKAALEIVFYKEMTRSLQITTSYLLPSVGQIIFPREWLRVAVVSVEKSFVLGHCGRKGTVRLLRLFRIPLNKCKRATIRIHKCERSKCQDNTRPLTPTNQILAWRGQT